MIFYAYYINTLLYRIQSCIICVCLLYKILTEKVKKWENYSQGRVTFSNFIIISLNGKLFRSFRFRIYTNRMLQIPLVYNGIYI